VLTGKKIAVVLNRLLSEQRGVRVIEARIALCSVTSWRRLLDPDGHAARWYRSICGRQRAAEVRNAVSELRHLQP
jgi:hypothetical protein